MLLLLCLPSCLPVATNASAEPQLLETSGVAALDGSLCFVGDHSLSKRTWFRLREWNDTPGLYEVDRTLFEAVELDLPKKRGEQLEDIAAVGDQVLVLSEAEARIFDAKGTLIQLPDAMQSIDTKHGDVGPEGLAARKNGDDWDLVVATQGGPGEPVRIYEHRMRARELAERWRVQPRNAAPLALTQEALATHINQHATSERQVDVEGGDWLRVPAIEWVPLADDTWGYLLVVGVRHGKGQWQHWLQHVHRSGVPVGSPFNIDAVAGKSKNWEGLCWIGDRRLLLVNDDGEQDPKHTRTHYLVIDLPPRAK